MQTDKKTAELIAELGLHQEKGKAGWKLRIRPDGLPWKKHGLGTQILEEAIQEAHAAHDNYERWIFKRTGFKIVSAFGWEMLTNEYLETLDLWRKRKTKTRIGLTNRGRDNIQRCLLFFRDFINEKLPLSCTKADLSAYYRNGLKTKKAITIGTYHSRIHAFFNWLQTSYENASFIHGAPIKIERLTPDEKRKHIYCNIGQVKKFIAGCDSTESGLKRKFILFAGFTAGMRKNEIAYSRPSWFDFKKKRIIVPGFDDFSGFTSKNRRTRYIPLDKTFEKFLLKEYTTWRKEDFMISGDGTESSAFSRYDFRKTFRTLREEVGMPHVTIHAMRHSYCTILATKNNSPESIAEFMGDDVKVIREHYLHYVNQYPKLKHKAFYL